MKIINKTNYFFDAPGHRLQKLVMGFIMAFSLCFVLELAINLIWQPYSLNEMLGHAFGAGLGTGLYFAFVHSWVRRNIAHNK